MAEFSVITQGRDVITMSQNFAKDPESQRNWFKRVLGKYVQFCHNKICNLDSPINKFITTITWYLAYLFLLLIAGLKPLSVKLAPNSHGQFAWYHACILFFCSSAMMHEAMNRAYGSLVSKWNFWRITALMCHICIFTSLTMRLVLQFILLCEEDEANDQFVCIDEDVLEVRL